MKKLLAALFIFALAGCETTSTPSRDISSKLNEVASVSQSAVQEQAAGNNAAIGYVAGKLPDSREKDVLGMFVADGYHLLGTPKAATQTRFETVAAQLLSADQAERAKGLEARGKLSEENDKLKTDLLKAQTALKDALAKEAADHKAELDKVRLEAEQAQKRLVSFIFFGGGALLLAIGVGMLVLAAHNPVFGPKVAFGTMLAGGASIGMGVLVLELMKQLEAHPAILWIGGFSIVAILTGVGAILYANHAHHVDSVKE